jgi:hypothetical protein
MSVSQPFICLLPSQSAKPDTQLPVQFPFTQSTLAMWAVEQVIPQPLQELVLD